MFSFLGEGIFCSAEDSPKCEVLSLSRTCCGGSFHRAVKRRPGEVISSQGPRPTREAVPGAGGYPLASGLQWNERPKPAAQRSPKGTFPQTPSASFNSPFGEVIACSGAAFAQKEEQLPGRGLYVPMQKGLGAKERQQERRVRGPPSPTILSRPAGPQLASKASQQGPVFAHLYTGVREDPVDMIMEKVLKKLPANSARALQLQRLSRGEYEVDGVRVSLGVRGSEVVAVETSGPPTGGGGEPLEKYIGRVADVALGRTLPLQLHLPDNLEVKQPKRSLASAAPAPSGPRLGRDPTGLSLPCRPAGSLQYLPRSPPGSFVLSHDGRSFYGVEVPRPIAQAFTRMGPGLATAPLMQVTQWPCTNSFMLVA